MKVGICSVAALISAMGIVTNSAAVPENNSSMAPLIPSAAPAATHQIDAQGLLDYAQTLIAGDELMFAMDVPTIPAQDTPIVVLAQAAPGSTVPLPDYLLNTCQETTSIGDPMSAVRGIDPAGWLTNYLTDRDHRFIDAATTASIKPILLQGTTHGELVPHTAPNGALYYMYDPIPEYTGGDQAVFMAEFEGKTYKIVVNLKVAAVEAIGDPTICPPPQLIKVNGKPVSGSLGFDASYNLTSTLNTSILDSISVDPSLVTLNIADLLGGAVGQTVTTTRDGAQLNLPIDINRTGAAIIGGGPQFLVLEW